MWSLGLSALKLTNSGLKQRYAIGNAKEKLNMNVDVAVVESKRPLKPFYKDLAVTTSQDKTFAESKQLVLPTPFLLVLFLAKVNPTLSNFMISAEYLHPA